MAETVESLTAKLEALKADYEAFKAVAQPVIDSHGPPPASLNYTSPPPTRRPDLFLPPEPQ